jgi:preprotein translocase subunit SecD
MKRALLIACVTAMLLSGCGVQAAGPTSPGPSPSPAAPATSSANTATRASIPALEFVPVSSFSKDATVSVGQTVAKGTYAPILTGSNVTSVQWVTEASGAASETVLSLKLDNAGAATLGRWTTGNIGAGLAVVFRGRVLAEATITGPLTTGSFVLGGSEVLANRGAIESATVPSP